MGFDFTGHVLRAPRSASGNQPTTNPANNGVVRDVRPPPTRVAAAPDLVDLHADQYTAAVLEAPGTTQVEYLVWAENSSNLAIQDDPTWALTEGTGTIPTGTLTVGLFEDGARQVIVTDDGNRSIGSILSLVVVNGETSVEVPLPVVGDTALVGIITQDADAGIARLSDGALTALGGGLSRGRGDQIKSVSYTLAPCRFWWTRNDRYETRFGWDGSLQRWTPYRGSAPKNLGMLEPDKGYQVAPLPVALPLNSYMEGNPGLPDTPAAIRVGLTAGAIALPVRVKVVANSAVSGFVFPEIGTDAVMGQSSGEMAFDPDFVANHAGKTIWYSYKGFREDEDGKLGKLLASVLDPLFISPIPGPDDRPFIRIGTRRALIPTLLANDAATMAASPGEGEVAISQTTGMLKFSAADIAKADPDDPALDRLWIGAEVFYDGVALNGIPQQVRNPATLINAAGQPAVVGLDPLLYIPELAPFPDGMGGGETYRGLGVSGVLFRPDATGALPDDPVGVNVPVRPGGDSLGEETTGRVRDVDDNVGEMMVFSKAGASEQVMLVDRDEDLPAAHKIKGGKVYISRQRTTIGGVHASRVQLGTVDQRRFSGEAALFLQASLTPATYTKKARVVSRNRLVFRFEADQKLYFAIGAQGYTWTAPTAQPFYSAAEVASSLVNDSVPPIAPGIGQAVAYGDRVAIEAANLDTGTVEIGWGNPMDLSGAAALGFLPGWRAEGGKHNWLFDSGVSFGMSRSILNLRRDKPDPDYVARGRVEDLVLQSQVQPNPFVFMDRPPLEDVAGYDEGVFFNIRNVLVEEGEVRIIDKRLQHFEDILHGFGEKKFSWLWPNRPKGVVHQTINAITLGAPGVIPESLLPALGGRLQVSLDGGDFEDQDPREDYLLPQEGGPGVAVLTKTYGKRYLYGADGVFTQGGTTFTVDVHHDPPGKFLLPGEVALPGDRLKVVAGDARGSYIVTSVTNDRELEVSPPFPVSGARVSWILFRGISLELDDPALVADQVYEPFTHLPEEPFKIRVLVPVGDVPANEAAQDVGRLQARVDDAILNGRKTSLRFGPVHASEGSAALYRLTRQRLGVIANGTLFVPAGDHFDEGRFQLMAGTEVLTPVANAGLPPANEVYYHPATRALTFGNSVLALRESADVWYVETFRDPDDLAVGEAELDLMTGEVNLSAPDMATHAGKLLYFAEQMVVEGRKDVAVAPIIGSVAFRKPLPEACLVEMIYWEADIEGRRVGSPTDLIEEFLPVFMRREEAVRSSGTEYTFNTAEAHVLKTGDDIPVQVWIGSVMQNFGNEQDYSIHYKGQKGVIRFTRGMADHVKVEVTYLILDTLGGERVYQTSRKPMYRPPFFLKKGMDHFGLRGNRVADFTAGQMLRIGSECFYLLGTQYFATSDVTRVNIYPPTVDEVGSRSPGRDVVSLVTAGPLPTHLDPDGENIATGAPAGFWEVLDTNVFPFDPVVRNQASITFQGNHDWVKPGHILEVSGLPLTIGQVLLNKDGTRTTFQTTAPFRKSVAGNLTVKVSRRPVYPPDVMVFLGVGPVVEESGYELVLFGEKAGNATLPGRTLARGVDYTLDPETGVVALLGPAQGALQGLQRLYLFHTKLRQLRVRKVQGTIVQPRWRASGLHTTLPSEENGLLGAFLTATFTFALPDTFYCRMPTLKRMLGEVAQSAAEEAKRDTPGQGPTWATLSGTENWKQGFLGLEAQRRDLTDKDRVARVFLDFYNRAIVTFEQIGETISGGFVGDRDGKFRFFVGRGSIYPPPGWEDAITGLLNSRLVWGRVFNEADPARRLTFLEKDSLAAPKTSTIANGMLVGVFPDAARLDKLQERQRALILNDVDDRLLVGVGRPKGWVHGWPVVPGRFADMADRHQYSRIFPTQARVFFATFPGLGADPEGGDAGGYSFGRFEDGEFQSTFGKVVGQVSNPVIGAITLLADRDLRPRRARGRIWGYFPEGIPANTFGASPAIPGPCMVVTPLELHEVPVNPETGFPNHELLLTADPEEGLPDISAGYPEMVIPGFAPGDQLAWGKPDGRMLAAKHLTEVAPFVGFTPILTDVFVATVEHGCVLTFKSKDVAGADVPITSASKLLVGTSPASGVPLTDFSIGRGDTVYVGTGSMTGAGLADTADPPKAEQMKDAANALPGFRDGFDMSARRDGSIVDRTLPSWEDPAFFPLKELMGQKSPSGLEHIEGTVEFVYAEPVPLQVPALLGEAKDDSGDQRIPYMKAANTELERFDEIAVGLSAEVFRAPDEFLIDDGELLAASTPVGPTFKWPATLMTQTDVQPGVSDGIGDLMPYDLLFIEVDGANGWQGILSVGDVDAHDGWSWIEPPRFGSQTTPPPHIATGVPGHAAVTGALVRYELDNYAVFLGGSYPADPQIGPTPAGCFVAEDRANNRIVLSMSDSTIAFNDGLSDGVGNINHLMGVPGNTIVITLYARQDPNIVAGPGGAIAPGDRHDNGEPLGVLRLNMDGSATWTPTATGATAHPVNTINVAGITAFTWGTFLGGGFFPLEPVVPAVASRRHLVLDIDPGVFNLAAPGVSFFDFLAPGGQESNWLMPYVDHVDRVTTLYGLEFTVSIEAAGTGHSTTAWIDEDRLTFHETIDTRYAKARGFTHPESGLSLETSLRVTQCDLASGGWSANNDLNGGNAFTFLSRTGDATSANGDWEPRVDGVNPEDGYLKVMGFEGNNNLPIPPIANIKLAAAPSTTPVATGTALAKAGYLNVPAYGSGGLPNISRGDLVVIRRSDDPNVWMTDKAGSYLVRWASDGTPLTVAGQAGKAAGLLTEEFPRIVSYDSGNHQMVLDDASGMPATGRVYIPLNPAGLGSANLGTFKTSLFSANYNAVGNVLTLNAYQWAITAEVPTAPELLALSAQVFGRQVSWRDNTGIQALPVSIRSPQFPTSPDLQGQEIAIAATKTVVGVRHLIVSTPHGDALPLHANTGNPSNDSTIVTSAGVPVGKVGVEEAAVLTAGTFHPEDAVLYDQVPGRFHFRLSDAQWLLLNNTHGHVGADVKCLIPGTQLLLQGPDGGGGVEGGFIPENRIGLEQAWPEPVLNLASGIPRVVDATHTMSTAYLTFLNDTTEEGVNFEVRRIRRFGGGKVTGSFLPLRFAYEIRRGLSTGWQQLPDQSCLVLAAAGTQLGFFDDPDVNINPGDILRVLNNDGTVTEAEVLEAVTPTALRVAAPGVSNTSGLAFEVWLRQAPVPHEQTHEQLLGLITDKVLHVTVADYETEQGGYCEGANPATWDGAAHVLKDSSPGAPNFVSLGIKVDDIMLIDPAGSIYDPLGADNGERGGRPQGDRGVAGRVGYEARSVSPFDDNRGFYRVTEAAANSLTLTGAYSLAGASGGDVVFGDSGFEYAVLPTVATTFLPGQEGQNDLRPTAVRVAGSHGTNQYSVAPFSYRIIRTSTLFEPETVDLVLTIRERMLSWMEELQSIFDGRWGGDFWAFQDEEHISDLGVIGIPETIRGLFPNEAIVTLLGEMGYSPYLNTGDCLSILDRRFWILDERLDTLRPDGTFRMQTAAGGGAYGDATGPYTAFTTPLGDQVRPVLPDRVALILDETERFRAYRYTWLTYRTHQQTGVLARIRLFDQERPKKEEERKRAILLQASADKT